MAIQIATPVFFRHLTRQFQSCCSVASQRWNSPTSTVDTDTNALAVTTPQHTEVKPIFQSADLTYNRSPLPPRECLVESLSHNSPVGLISLHPEVFSQFPLLHVIFQNARWQSIYKKVETNHALSRAECRGGGRKPWPQKGTGRARHGSVRSPLFNKGGKTFGPRADTIEAQMLPQKHRVMGLTSTFSAKYAQEDIKVVDSLHLPTSDSSYIRQLADDRMWGPSVLFVDVDDVMPENITVATDQIGHMILMPVYGLNVHSMLKYMTLVLTLAAVRKIEERIIYNIYCTNSMTFNDKYVAKTFLL